MVMTAGWLPSVSEQVLNLSLKQAVVIELAVAHACQWPVNVDQSISNGCWMEQIMATISAK